jgi:hypothetical protein
LKDPDTGKIYPSAVALDHLKPFEPRPPDWNLPEITPQLLQPGTKKPKPPAVPDTSNERLQEYLDSQPPDAIDDGDSASEDESENENSTGGMKLRSGKTLK